MARQIVVAFAISLLSMGAHAAAQPAQASAPATTLSIDRASLDPVQGLLTIQGTGLGPDVVVTVGGEVLPLEAGATNEQVQAAAPARVLETAGSYRITVADPGRQAAAAFVVVSQPPADAANLSAANGLTRRDRFNGVEASGRSPSSDATADTADGQSTRAARGQRPDVPSSGPSPQLIEDTLSRNTAVGARALRSIAGGSYNSAFGYEALGLATTGAYNTAAGAQSMALTTTGQLNSAHGYHALLLNVSGSYNVASGASALERNSTGERNVASGAFALASNTTGGANTGIGHLALANNSTANGNVAVGFEAMKLNSTGFFNSASGAYALGLNSTGAHNTASGYAALFMNTTASENTANGAYALRENTIGTRNAAIGFESLFSNVNGNDNVAVGHGSLRTNGSGNNNAAVGTNALRSNTLGDENTAVGTSALVLNTVGRWNTALGAGAAAGNVNGISNVGVGHTALYNNSSGGYNTAVGYAAGYFGGGSNNVFLGANVWGTATDNNTMRLGLPYDVSTGDGQNRTFIAGIYGTQLTSPAQQVFVDVNGQLGILGPPIVAQPISGTLNAVPRDHALEARLEALDALVQEQQATIARLTALADEHAAALKTLRGSATSTPRKR